LLLLRLILLPLALVGQRGEVPSAATATARVGRVLYDPLLLGPVMGVVVRVVWVVRDVFDGLGRPKGLVHDVVLPRLLGLDDRAHRSLLLVPIVDNWPSLQHNSTSAGT
jgi:hypothetical protein